MHHAGPNLPRGQPPRDSNPIGEQNVANKQPPCAAPGQDCPSDCTVQPASADPKANPLKTTRRDFLRVGGLTVGEVDRVGAAPRAVEHDAGAFDRFELGSFQVRAMKLGLGNWSRLSALTFTARTECSFRSDHAAGKFTALSPATAMSMV